MEPSERERRERKERRYQEAVDAYSELRAFLTGHRAGTADDPKKDPHAEQWRKFIEDRIGKMMNAVWIVGEELEDDELAESEGD